MRIAIAVLSLAAFAAQADVVGSMTGPNGEKLLLTDELANCRIPDKYASYVIDAKRNTTASGCWTAKDDHVIIEWEGHGVRYWPIVQIDWRRAVNSKLHSPVL